MRAAAAQIQAFNRSLIACPVEQRPHGEELIEREFAVKDVASGKAIGFFEIFGCDDLMAQNDLRQIRRVLRNCLHHRFAERLALALPIAIFQLIRSVLHVDGHHMLSGRERATDRKATER